MVNSGLRRNLMMDCGRFRGFAAGLTRGGYRGTPPLSIWQIWFIGTDCADSCQEFVCFLPTYRWSDPLMCGGAIPEPRTTLRSPPSLSVSLAWMRNRVGVAHHFG